MSVRGGRLTLKVNGRAYPAAGEFKYGGGDDKRTALIGTNGVEGFTTEATVPFIEGEIFKGDAFFDDISKIENATVTLELADGKVFSLYEAWTVNEKGGEAGSKEGKIQVRFEGMKKMEV